MIAALRTAWAMLNLQSLLALLLAFWVVAQMRTGVKIYEALIPLAIAVSFGLLASRIARALQVGVWRVLPDGTRTVVRAIAIIVVALSLLFGGVYRWAAPAALADVPIGTTLAVFIHLSLLGFLLLLGIGRQLPRLFTALYLFGCSLSLGITLQEFGHTPEFWIAGASLCAAAWVYGSLAGFRAPNYSRRCFSWGISFETLLARTGAGLWPAGAPTRRLLRSGRSSFANVLVAILVVVLIALLQHVTVGRVMFGKRTLPLIFFVLLPIMSVAIFAAFHASRFGEPAKRLWLRWAESRPDIFRLVERTVIGDICITVLAACATVVSLAVLRGVDVPAIGALKILIAMLGVAITIAYVGMLASTAHALWWRILLFGLGGFGALHTSSWWLTAFGAAHLEVFRAQPPPLMLAFRTALLCLALLALRYAALARWNRIDWSHYRSTRK